MITPHAWDVTPREAMAIQARLSPLVETRDRLGEVRRVAGVDIGFEARGTVTRAAVAVLDFPGLSLIERSIVRLPTAFPYVPGLLSFREAPAALLALSRLSAPPDLVLYDGQGLAHPRRLGIACHIGLLTGLPSIGVAKSRLIGCHDEVPAERGAWTPLLDGDDILGAVLRSRAGVSPIYVSIGHRTSLETAVHWVMAVTTRYRLPETTRHAHRLASSEAGALETVV